MIGIPIDVNSRKLPTVFRYEGKGKNIAIAGSFDDWKSEIPLVRRFVNPPPVFLYLVYSTVVLCLCLFIYICVNYRIQSQ